MESWIIFIVVGLIAGFVAGQIWKGSGFGLIGNLIVGCVGAVLGGWLFGALNIHIVSGLVTYIVSAIVGALILLFIIKQIR